MFKKLALAVAITAAFLAGAQAAQIDVIDLNTADLNSIIGVTSGANLPPGNGWIIVNEDYNEKYTTPYLSHDGNAVVNSTGGYFDKLVSFSGIGQAGAPAVYDFVFNVTNTTPYTWSDYHIEFWNSTFTARLTTLPVVSVSSTIFINSALTGSVAEFWAPNWQHIGETGTYTLLGANLSGLADSNGVGSFGLRQIATTVPEPETYAMLLVGIGLLGLVKLRRPSSR